jgi:hypothetical protein
VYTIYKYPIEVTDSQTARIPEGAQILDTQMQNGTPCIWALVDPDAVLRDRTVYVFGTGHHVPSEPLQHIGTFQIMGGNLVFHAFISPERS